MISQEQLDNWFLYHSPTADQVPKYSAIRIAGRELARVIVECAPDSADTWAAINKVRESVMMANAAIACDEGDPLALTGGQVQKSVSA